MCVGFVAVMPTALGFTSTPQTLLSSGAPCLAIQAKDSSYLGLFDVCVHRVHIPLLFLTPSRLVRRRQRVPSTRGHTE